MREARLTKTESDRKSTESTAEMAVQVAFDVVCCHTCYKWYHATSRVVVPPQAWNGGNGLLLFGPV